MASAASGSASQFLSGCPPRAADAGYVETTRAFRLPRTAECDDHDRPAPASRRSAASCNSEAAGATGRNWLFFGARHFDDEFLYQTEWQAALKRGALTWLDVAFSGATSRSGSNAAAHVRVRRHCSAGFEGGARLCLRDDARRWPSTLRPRACGDRACPWPDDAGGHEYVDRLLAEPCYARATCIEPVIAHQAAAGSAQVRRPAEPAR